MPAVMLELLLLAQGHATWMNNLDSVRPVITSLLEEMNNAAVEAEVSRGLAAIDTLAIM